MTEAANQKRVTKSKSVTSELFTCSLSDKSPVIFFISILSVIFVSDVLIMLIINALTLRSNLIKDLIDATILTIIVSPITYFSLFRPLIIKNIACKQSREDVERLNLHLSSEICKLHTSEERFRSLLETIPDIVYRIDVNGIFTYVNDAIGSLGYEPEELMGKHFSSIIVPEEAEYVSRELILPKYTGSVTGNEKSPKLFDERRMGKRSTSGLEVHLIKKGAKDVKDNLSAKPEENTEDNTVIGEVNSSGIYELDCESMKKELVGTIGIIKASEIMFLGSAGVIRDITARKTIETLLQNERRRLFSILDRISAFVYLLSPNHDILFANRYFHEHFGNPDGKKCYELLSRRNTPCEGCPATKVLKTKNPGNWIWTNAPDGCIYQVYDNPFTDFDGTGLILEIGVDITENKRAEEKLRKSEERFTKFFTQISMGICFTNVERRIIDCNPALCNILGFTREELIDKSISSISHPDDDIINEEFLNESIKDKKDVFKMEKRYIRKDGTILWGSLTVSIVYDDAGQPEYIFALLEDITERKQIEYSLNKSQQLLEKTFESLDQALFIVYPLTRTIISCNSAAERIFGYKKEEMIGSTVEFLHVNKEEYENFVAKLFNALDTNGLLHTEVRLKRKDGKIITTEITITEIIDDTGHRTDTVSVIRDIGERKRMEQELNNSFNLLRTIMDSLDAVVYVADMQTHELLFVNKYVKDTWGDIEGKTCWQRFHVEQKGPCELCENHKLLTPYGEPTGVCVWELQNTVNNRWYCVHANAIKWIDGRIVAMKVATDITHLKEVEQSIRRSNALFNSLLEAIPDLIYFKDLNRRYIITNKAFEKMLGIDRNAILGKTDEEFLSSDVAEICKQGDEVSLKGEKIVTEEQCRNFIDGGSCVLETVKTPIYNDMNTIIGMVGVSRDITARKIMENQLQDLNSKLEMRVQYELTKRRQQEQLLVQQSKMAAMGEMIGAIAHQWKQPLNAISLITLNMKDAYEYGELTREHINETSKTIWEQTAFMSKTINDFMNFLKPSKEKIAFDVEIAIEEILSMFEGLLRKNNVIVSFEKDDFSESYKVTGYPNEFKHVILNIINNSKDAIIATLEKGLIGGDTAGKININLAKEDGKIVVTISDNGGGIPDEIMVNIFEPYFTTKSEEKGTGIGLYMSKTIIENNMGGKLTAGNTEKGAQFRIEI